MKRIDTCSAEGSLEYLAWVRGRTVCAICLEVKPIEAFHKIHVMRGGRKDKPNPRHWTAIPSCHEDHSMYHTSPYQFKRTYPGLDLWKEVALYNLLYWQTKEDR